MCKRLCPQVIAAACLFTSAKIGEYPKALQNVLKGVWQCKFKGQLDRLSEMSDKVRPVCRLLLTSAPPPNVLDLLLHSNT